VPCSTFETFGLWDAVCREPRVAKPGGSGGHGSVPRQRPSCSKCRDVRIRQLVWQCYAGLPFQDEVQKGKVQWLTR
jgi:hypothetical protein